MEHSLRTPCYSTNAGHALLAHVGFLLGWQMSTSRRPRSREGIREHFKQSQRATRKSSFQDSRKLQELFGYLGRGTVVDLAGSGMIAMAAQMRYLKLLAQGQGATITQAKLQNKSTASTQVDIFKSLRNELKLNN
eukprot:2276892-Amphidinium_carterae.2